MSSLTKIALIILISVALRLVPIIHLSTTESIATQELSITDIDYKVYMDAANRESPYDRHTYRYSPLLAYLMNFNDKFEYAGKIIFVLFDLISMVGLVVLSRASNGTTLVKLYGFNPLFIYLTVRGSCESINMALMIWCFVFIFGSNGNVCLGDFAEKRKMEDKRKWRILGYVLYGLWVHFRVYPIFMLPVIIIHEYKLANKSGNSFLRSFIALSLLSGGTFLSLLALFYSLYGEPFLEQTYFYHLTRLDNRHSISPYFYEIYLSLNTQSFIRSLAQISVILSVIRKVHKSISPFYAQFIITYGFVCFNKVITMQYYMWVFGSLLLLLPESSLWTNSNRRFQKSFAWLMQWILGILIWVWLSIKLEKDGDNVFNLMWLMAVLKLFSDIWVLIGFMGTIVNRQGYQILANEDPIPNPRAVKTEKSKNL